MHPTPTPRESTPTPVVSFDLDGVLIRNPFELGVEPFVRRHIHASSRLCDEPELEAHARIDGAVREAWNARMAAGHFVDAFDWDAIFGEVSTGFGGDAVPDVTGLVRRFCAEEGMIALLPGAREGLHRLREAGVRLVAMTNGYAKYQEPTLDALGILPFFERIASPDQAGAAKPHRAIFDAVPGLVAHVGDTLPHDVLGANRAGVRSVWLLPTAPKAVLGAEPDHETLRDLVRAALERDVFRAHHAEATLEECLPDAVARDANEAADHVLRWLDQARGLTRKGPAG